MTLDDGEGTLESLAQTLKQIQDKYNNKWTGAYVTHFITDTQHQHETFIKKTKGKHHAK